jgi:large repetitive protein
MNLRPTMSSFRKPPRLRLALLAVLALGVSGIGGVSGASAGGTNNYASTLYLSSTASALLGSGSYQLVTTAPSSVSTATQNRIAASGTTGYQSFQPGVKPANSLVNTPTPDGASASTTPTNKGWIVDGSGAVSFAAGTWTFQTTVTENSATGEAATLAVGMWEVSVSGGVVSSPTLLVDPNCSATPCSSGAAPGDASPGTNFITTSGSTTVSLPVSLGAFSLTSGEHLYVQYWRHQTVGFTATVGASQRLATLSVNDGTAEITHPTANAFPDVPALGAIAARINNTTPTLTATFSDPDASDTGTLAFQLCSDSACSSVLQSGTTSSGIANGANGTWTPAALADGTYYWRAEATDSAANVSGWSATNSFTVDTVPPGNPTFVSPSDGGRVNSQLSATFVDSDATDSGSVEFQVCGNSTCTAGGDPLASGSSAVVTGGTAVSWAPAGLTGTPPTGYYWRIRGVDVAGNQSASWSATRSFTYDTNPPGTPTLSGPADGSYLGAAPALGGTFGSSDTGDSGTIGFQVCSDAACATVEASGSSASGLANGATGTWTPGGLADGLHYWRARGQDAAGNLSGWSSTESFTLDTTPPADPALGAVAARAQTTPQLSATFSDPPATDSGTLVFQLCTTSSCGTVLQSNTATGVAENGTVDWTPTSLAEGAYDWRVRATDAAGNLSAWSDGSFVVDRTPPGLPAFVSPANGGRVNSPLLHATFVDSDSTDSGTVTFQLCGDSACSSVLQSSTSATVGSGSAVTWTPGGLADGTYYWRLSAIDVAGNQGASTTTHSFVLDTNPPAVPVLTGPADDSYAGSDPALGATFSSSDAGDSGTINYEVCTDSACSAVVQSGSSPGGLASGASGTWTPSGLADGEYYWRAQAQDAAGNQSAWSATVSFTLDTVPPPVPAPSGPAGGALVNARPTLTATYTDSAGGSGSGSVSFRICTTASCSAVIASTTIDGVAGGDAVSWTPANLPNGTFYWQVETTNAAGNASGWSAATSFTFDDTPPAVPVPTVSSGLSFKTAPQLTAVVDDPGNPSGSTRILVELCTDAPCTMTITTGYSAAVPNNAVAGWQVPALPDGVYYWRALAEDAAGNQSGWTAARSFTIDSVAPSVPRAGGPAAGTVVAAAHLSATAGDVGAGGMVEFQVCSDSGCTRLVATGFASVPGSGAAATWTPTGLPNGPYFWRARALDAAGNASAWTATNEFVLDQTPPGMPRALTARVTGKILTLRWQTPKRAGHLAGYALLVDGKRARVLGPKTHVVRIRLRRVETRWFAVAALDAAGNAGTPTKQVDPDTVKGSMVPRNPTAHLPGRP